MNHNRSKWIFALIVSALFFPGPDVSAGVSGRGALHLAVNTSGMGGVPDFHAASYDIPGRRITLFDAFSGEPVELASGEEAYAWAGWLMLLYRDCGDAVLASDPSQPFVDSESGLGPCEFLREFFGMDVATDMASARAVMEQILVSFTLDGVPLADPLEVVKPFKYRVFPDGKTSACSDDYDFFIFPILEEFDYLDPDGQGPADTCVGKFVSASLPLDLLTRGSHELVYRYELLPVQETLEFFIEVLVH